ncbi:MAG: protein kinase [Candidatus Aminicenantes bacterium]|nr:protein kinase [Candidatus Aminicenantes bacterium]
MIGQTISHYHILDKIGSGGMGEVYKAEDTKLKRRVALKFLPIQMTADKEARSRFEREAQAAAALNHPNIVTVHEIGEHEGQVFIAMEYVEGQTLKELITVNRTPSTVDQSPIAPHPLPLAQVLEIATQIAEGLAVAHAKGIVHRDIKPQNILVDKDGRVKILDFGLAKLKGISSLTKESSTLGTIHYMSPEQTMGKEVDHRTDIWSLGVVLYEMLTGKVPFKGDYEQAVVYAILNEEPGRLTSIRKDAPLEFDRILEKALAKEPDDRYQHADDMLVDLKHLKRDSRPDRQPVPSAPRRKTWRWPRWAIPVVAILFVAAAAALFFVSREKPKPDVSKQTTDIRPVQPAWTHSIAFVSREKPKPDVSKQTTDIRPVQPAWTHSIAVLPFKNLSDSKEDEYFSDGITDDIIAQLSKIGDLKVISRTSVMTYKNTAKNIRDIGKELDVWTVLEGSVRRAKNQVRIVAQLIDARNEGHLWADTYDKELIEVFAIQSDVAQKIAAALKAKLSPEEKERIENKQTENTEAYELFLKGRFYLNKRVTTDFQKAVAHFNQAIEKDPSYALAYAGLASAYAVMPYYGSGSKENYALALEAASKALEIDPTLAEAHTALGYVKENQFDLASAEIEYKRAIELNPSYPTAHHWYSTFLRRLGRFEEAITESRRAVELDPLSLIINVNLGHTLICMRQYDQAVIQCQKVIDLDPQFPWSYFFLGMVAELQGKFTEAINEYKKAALLSKIQLPGEIGRCYARAGRRKEALEALRELHEYAKQGLSVSFKIADVYYVLGDKDNAVAWLEKAIQEHDPQLSEIIRPVYEDLRSDPKCSKLLKKVGLIK